MSRVLQELVELAARGETDAVVELLRNVGRVLNPSAAEGGHSAAADGLRTRPTSSIELGDAKPHVTIFPLRRGALLPLHNHPAMTVVSKVLHGRMRVESFEWADRDASLARVLGERDVDENTEPLVIAGTLHRIAALTDCAFIDVFAPYYDDARPCRYYRIVERRDGGVVLLEPTVAVPYRAEAHRS
jgi:hypothetical protein